MQLYTIRHKIPKKHYLFGGALLLMTISSIDDYIFNNNLLQYNFRYLPTIMNVL